jgi:pilus assembly protein CpaB
VLALVFGVSAAIGVNLLTRKPEPEVPDTVTVVVASSNIPRFTTLTENQLETREVPRSLAPSGTISRVEDAVERATLAHLVTDELVLDSKLTAKGEGRGMAQAIRKGMRAFTISTTTLASGVAGFILPGSTVDVLLTVTNSNAANDPTGGGQTITLLQDVEILAVDQLIKAPKENRVDPKELRSVTLLVTPAQATKLDLGQNKGILHLTLRNPDDHSPASTKPATLAELGLLGELPKRDAKEPQAPKDDVVPAPPPAPVPLQIRVMRGSAEGSVIFEPLQPAGR